MPRWCDWLLLQLKELFGPSEQEFVYDEPYFPLTTFEMVGQLHKAAGHPTRTLPQIPSKEECKLMVGLIREELRELEEALENGDIIETADALGDLRVVVSGAGQRCGMNLDQLDSYIHESNMSKFPKTSEEAAEGAKAYLENGVNVSIDSREDGTFVILRDDGKFLKGPGFFEPKIKEFLATQGLYVAD